MKLRTVLDHRLDIALRIRTKPSKKQGRNPVMDGWAGAVMQKPLANLEIF